MSFSLSLNGWLSLGIVACLFGSCSPGRVYSRLAVRSGEEAGGAGGVDGPMLNGSGGNGTGAGTGGSMGTGDRATGGVGLGGMARAGMGIGGGGDAGPVGRDAGGADAGGAAGPLILSIDFVGAVPRAAGGAGGTTLMAISMAPTEVAGVKAAENWNSAVDAMGSLGALKLSDGSVTAASVTWHAPLVTGSVGIYGVNLLDAPGNARMMNGYLDPTSIGMPATVMVDSLPPAFVAGGYDVYVYALGHLDSGTRTYNYTLGGATFSVSQTGPSPTTVPPFVLAPTTNPRAGNYVIFRNVAGASFTLTATPGAGTPRAPVNGIQIISPTGS
jgi:hypothetical protein